jgi:hypothetical protein
MKPFLVKNQHGLLKKLRAAGFIAAVRHAPLLFQKPISVKSAILLPSMKYTQTTLAKLEKAIEEGGYIVRFERGNFQSGFCLLEEKKVVVLNKFLPLEGKINTLIDLLPQLHINTEALSSESKKVWDDAMARVQNTGNKEA